MLTRKFGTFPNQINDPEDIVRRSVALLKPGGWIVLEEPDDEDPDASGVFTGIVGKNRMMAWASQRFQARGTDLGVGRRIEGMLRRTNALESIGEVKLVMPLSGRSDSETSFMRPSDSDRF